MRPWLVVAATCAVSLGAIFLPAQGQAPEVEHRHVSMSILSSSKTRNDAPALVAASANYLPDNRNRVRDVWRPSQANFTYSTEFVFFVRRSGELDDLRIAVSSGDPLKDKLAEQAIREAMPFPQVPERYLGDIFQFQAILEYLP